MDGKSSLEDDAVARIDAAAAQTEREAQVAFSVLQHIIGNDQADAFDVRLWNGARWRNLPNPRFTLVLNHPGALRAMFSSPSELALGEAFIYSSLLLV
jgi:cyclopropane-fatty-acyl-phospholipid synthase